MRATMTHNWETQQQQIATAKLILADKKYMESTALGSNSTAAGCSCSIETVP